MLVAEREPTLCYRDAHSVDTLRGHIGRKAGKTTVRPRFPLFWTFFSRFAKGPYSFFGRRSSSLDVSHWEGQASWAWSTVVYPCSAVG